ncbi:MAG: phosphatidylinositol mannoside acyltransferase [Propionibacteriaceae bacterium]
MSSLREAVVRNVYRAGWLGASRIPPGAVRGVISAGSRLARRHNGPHVQTLRHNLSGAIGSPASDDLVRAALASYLRNFYEVLALPGWPAGQVTDRVTTVGEETLRTAYASGGAVVALPHSANWDLAGAWACQTGMPVTTVAEQLADAEFRAFVAFREGLGMEVLSHRDPGTLAALVGAVRAGRLVCLVADRDLAGSGLPVSWGEHTVTMPGGPALVARRAGAALIPAVCAFTPTGMRITFGDVVEQRPGRDGLQAMTQDVASFFAAEIARQPEDWHMMQPFFQRDAA